MDVHPDAIDVAIARRADDEQIICLAAEMWAQAQERWAAGGQIRGTLRTVEQRRVQAAAIRAALARINHTSGER